MGKWTLLLSILFIYSTVQGANYCSMYPEKCDGDRNISFKRALKRHLEQQEQVSVPVFEKIETASGSRSFTCDEIQTMFEELVRIEAHPPSEEVLVKARQFQGVLQIYSQTKDCPVAD